MISKKIDLQLRSRLDLGLHYSTVQVMKSIQINQRQCKVSSPGVKPQYCSKIIGAKPIMKLSTHQIKGQVSPQPICKIAEVPCLSILAVVFCLPPAAVRRGRVR